MINDADINILVKILSNSATAEEQEYFDTWLSESDSNRIYFEDIKILWERSEETYSKIDFDKAVAKIKIGIKIHQIQPKTSILTKRFIIQAAASIILLFGLTLAVLHYSKTIEKRYIVYSTTDQVKEIVLRDSSHIWLNGNSKLTVPSSFSAFSRKVTLEGEAYFEITHDESKPFKVRAENTIIKVLGTTFDVKTEKESGNVSVVVNSGRVAFYKANRLHENYILTQGTRGQFNTSDQKIIISGNKNQNYLSWKTGTLSFYDTPLKEVCAILSNHYRTSVTTNLSDSNLFLTGNFQDESLDDILNTIELTLDLKAVFSKDGIIIHNQMSR